MAAAVVEFLSPASAVAQPNLTPYEPSGWSDKIVVARTTNTTTDSANLLTTDTLYVNWAVANFGTAGATNSFYVYLYLDGVFNQSWSITSLPENSYVFVNNYSIGSLGSGSHTLEILADATMAVPGDNRSDDSYTKTIMVGAVTLSAPAPLTPANGSIGQPPVPWFSWSTVTNAGSYRIIIATNAADLPSSPTATNGGSSVVIDAVSPTNNFSPTIQLTSGTTYHWEAHARGAGENGTWSSVESFTVGPIGNGLTIVPTFDSTITSDPNAAAIEATIEAAISVYRSDFSDQVTASFTFAEMTVGLGDNDSYSTSEAYSSYRSALVNHATTADDATALAHLPSTTDNPVNGNSQVELKLPLARALGFNVNPPAGQPDSTIYLNTSIMNLSSTQTAPAKYSLFAAASHEMDEALGFGSVLNGLTNGAPAPTGPVMPEDLFRYTAGGARSLTTSVSASSYCSLDGTTDLAQFNQYQGGDFGDWYSYNVTVAPQVQNAFLSPGVNPVLEVELRVLDAIGFTRILPASNNAAILSGVTVSGGNCKFNLMGSVGSNYVVQFTSNLFTWFPLSTNTIPAGGSVSITNAEGANRQRFYRAMLQ